MYYVTQEKNKISAKDVQTLLKQSYWGNHRTLETVQTSMEHSVCFGVFEKKTETLVGFCRVITDMVTTFYLCDVIVDEAHRGKGLGKLLVETVVTDPRLKDLRGILLTHEAHGLYEKYGFKTIENRYMGFNAI